MPMRAALLLLALALAAPAPAAEAPERIFFCSFGARQVEVVRDGATLIYRFGRPGRPELVLSGDAASGNVHYHRTLYPRGEDQTLRFQSGAHSYLIFNAFQTPDYRQEGAVDESGLLLLRRGRRIALMYCRDGAELIEYPIFDGLLRDEEDLVPRLGIWGSAPLHPPCPPLYRAPHHSLSEQGTPSRSALNALID
jgi:hypothetical protein